MANLQIDIISCRVRIGMRSMKMDIGGTGCVQAVRVPIEELGVNRTESAVRFRAAFDVQALFEAARADLIDEGQLDEIADARAQRRTRHRLKTFSFIPGFFGRLEAKTSNRLLRAPCHSIYGSRNALFLITQIDCSLQPLVRL